MTSTHSTMQIEDYVTKPELARHLRVSVRTVDNMMARHDIPYVLIGRLVRFKITEVDQSLEQKYRLNSAWE
jgi:excisionase family DNA binding protein